MAVASKLIIPDAAAEFRHRVLAQIAGIKEFEIFPNQVLLAHYIRTTAGYSGKILAPDRTKDEDRYQGKVGLVVLLGSAAFKDSTDAAFYGFNIKEGDWVLYRNSDGWDFDYVPRGTTDRVACRLLIDADIKARIPRPEVIY